MKGIEDLKNLTIDEFAKPLIYTAKRNDKLGDVVKLMEKAGVRHIPVVEDKKAVGILSQRDINVLSTKKYSDHFKVEDIMIQDPYTVESGTLLKDALSVMIKNKFGSILVANKGQLVSIFTSIDVMKALYQILD